MSYLENAFGHVPLVDRLEIDKWLVLHVQSREKQSKGKLWTQREA